MDGRVKRAGHRLSRGVAACVAALIVVLGAATGAEAGSPTAQSGLEVAPGIYLASAAQIPGRAGHRQSSGPSTPTPVPGIVGGRPSTIGKWPWQVSLSYRLAKRHDAYGSH